MRQWEGWVIINSDDELHRFAPVYPDQDDEKRMIAVGWKILPARLKANDVSDFKQHTNKQRR